MIKEIVSYFEDDHNGGWAFSEFLFNSSQFTEEYWETVQYNTMEEDAEWTTTKPITYAQAQATVNQYCSDLPLMVLRQERDLLLQESDWSQGTDVPSDLKTAYATYRQELRDLPANSPDAAMDSNGVLTGVTWPTKP